MRRVVVALLFAVVASARFASAAAISVAGAECGSPPLLGLQILVPASGTNLGTACPDQSFGAIIGNTGSGNTGPLYGSPVQTIDFSISDPSQIAGLTIISGSAFDKIVPTLNGFQLQGGTGILACAPTPIAEINCFTDAVVTFRGFTPGTVLTVTAVNGITPVPEPATGALLLAGLSGAVIRRVRRRGDAPRGGDRDDEKDAAASD